LAAFIARTPARTGADGHGLVVVVVVVVVVSLISVSSLHSCKSLAAFMTGTNTRARPTANPADTIPPEYIEAAQKGEKQIPAISFQ